MLGHFLPSFYPSLLVMTFISPDGMDLEESASLVQARDSFSVAVNLLGSLGTENVTMIYSQSGERLSFNKAPSGLGAGLSGRTLAYLCAPDPGFHP